MSDRRGKLAANGGKSHRCVAEKGRGSEHRGPEKAKEDLPEANLGWRHGGHCWPPGPRQGRVEQVEASCSRVRQASGLGILGFGPQGEGQGRKGRRSVRCNGAMSKVRRLDDNAPVKCVMCVM